MKPKTPKKRAGKPRKPQGRFWCGNYLIVDEFVSKYGLRNLRELRDWLTRVIDWAEEAKRVEG